MKKIYLFLLLISFSFGDGFPHFGSGPKLSTDNTWTGTNTFSGAVTFTGTVTFSGTVSGNLTVTGGAAGESVFNESGVDADFRVEGDTETHALFVQGSDG